MKFDLYKTEKDIFNIDDKEDGIFLIKFPMGGSDKYEFMENHLVDTVEECIDLMNSRLGDLPTAYKITNKNYDWFDCQYKSIELNNKGVRW